VQCITDIKVLYVLNCQENKTWKPVQLQNVCDNEIMGR